MKTEIFVSYAEFHARPDKTVNGVSPEFAARHPNYAADNASNVACYNCLHCDDCTSSTGCVACAVCAACINCTGCNDCDHCSGITLRRGASNEIAGSK